MKGYCGTYTTVNSEGIYSFEFNPESGQLSDVQLFAKVESPKTIVKEKGILFSVFEDQGKAGVIAFDDQGEYVDSIFTETKASCFITVKNNQIFTANYHEGYFTVLSWDGEKFSLIMQDKIKEKAGCHHVLFVEEYTLVPCLFLDQVIIYDENLNRCGSIEFPKGTGPRNGVYSQQRKEMILLSELSNELFFFDVQDGVFQLKDFGSILANGETDYGQSSALRMTADEKVLIAATRGKNELSLLDFQGNLCQIISTQGNHPRDFVLSKDSCFVVVANKDSDNLVSFRLENGTITEKVSEVKLPEAISIAWEV